MNAASTPYVLLRMMSELRKCALVSAHSLTARKDMALLRHERGIHALGPNGSQT
jgi:hypothetical protein